MIDLLLYREELQEQHQLGQEIGEVIAHGNVGYELPDEDELEAELEGMEQEAMDERMLHTGTVPVAVSQLPSPATQERKSFPLCFPAVYQ